MFALLGDLAVQADTAARGWVSRVDAVVKEDARAGERERLLPLRRVMIRASHVDNDRPVVTMMAGRRRERRRHKRADRVEALVVRRARLGIRFPRMA